MVFSLTRVISRGFFLFGFVFLPFVLLFYGKRIWEVNGFEWKLFQSLILLSFEFFPLQFVVNFFFNFAPFYFFSPFLSLSLCRFVSCLVNSCCCEKFPVTKRHLFLHLFDIPPRLLEPVNSCKIFFNFAQTRIT